MTALQAPPRAIQHSPTHTGRLTPGERFHLARRRAGLTRPQAGAKFGVPEGVVGDWEHDRPRVGRPVPAVKLEGGLTPGERYHIARRRCGYRLKVAAGLIGVSHVTLIAWERSTVPVSKLDHFYQDIGTIAI